MTVKEAIREAAQRLATTSDTARLDAEVLMAHALGVSRSQMLIGQMDKAVPDTFEALVARRAKHEPVAYIIGNQEFYGLELEVGPGVLIPRADSETLIDAARELFSGRKAPKRIFDLGTGSGALLLAAMSVFPEAAGHGVDASERVANVFRRNARRHGEGRNIGFTLADWRQPDWASSLGRADLVLCNPPYVEQDAQLDPDVRAFEPASALFAGQEGLDDYRILMPQIREIMGDQAIAIFEIGASQAEVVSAIARQEGFEVEIRHDLANRPRCVVLW